MIRDLLTPEAHQDGYVWAAVLLSHAFIGGVGVVFMGWWFLPVYIAFEAVQAVRARRALYWDSVLDIVAVVLGGVSVSQGSLGAALAVLSIALFGWYVRRGNV